MRLVCPACGTIYDVPSDMAASRSVKCVRCGHVWRAQVPPDPSSPPVSSIPGDGMPGVTDEAHTPSASPPAVVPVAPAEVRLSVSSTNRRGGSTSHSVFLPENTVVMGPVPRKRSSKGVLLAAIFAWGISLAVVAGGGWLAVHKRQQVMAFWPPSIRLYVVLGLI